MLEVLKSSIKRFEKVLDKFPEVKYAGDHILRRTTEVIKVEEGLRIGERLGDILLRYRKEVGYGRGFAAPQIGESKSVFVTFVEDTLKIFINPVIVQSSFETNFYRELCLSSGIMSADVERAEWIIMEWTDEQGERMKEKFDGFLARLYQHEEAHLRGRLNLDDASKGGIEFALFDPLKERLRKTRSEN